MWMELEGIALNEISQRKKEKCQLYHLQVIHKETKIGIIYYLMAENPWTWSTEQRLPGRMRREHGEETLCIKSLNISTFCKHNLTTIKVFFYISHSFISHIRKWWSRELEAYTKSGGDILGIQAQQYHCSSKVKGFSLTMGPPPTFSNALHWHQELMWIFLTDTSHCRNIGPLDDIQLRRSRDWRWSWKGQDFRELPNFLSGQQFRWFLFLRKFFFTRKKRIDPGNASIRFFEQEREYSS